MADSIPAMVLIERTVRWESSKEMDDSELFERRAESRLLPVLVHLWPPTNIAS